jgi:nicotinamidase-related amidase
LATGKIGERGQAFVLAGLPGVSPHSELNPLTSEAVFDKIAMSAFEGTPLDFAFAIVPYGG